MCMQIRTIFASYLDMEICLGYQVAFSQLVFAGKNDYNPVSDVKDPKQFLAVSLNRLSQVLPGKV